MKLRRYVSRVVACAIVASGSLLVMPSAKATDTLDILLLGDSYGAGNGARDDDGRRSYYGPAQCLRSHDNWAQRWARTVGGVVRNEACSGARTEQFMSPQDDRVSGWFEGTVVGRYTAGGHTVDAGCSEPMFTGARRHPRGLLHGGDRRHVSAADEH